MCIPSNSITSHLVILGEPDQFGVCVWLLWKLGLAAFVIELYNDLHEMLFLFYVYVTLVVCAYTYHQCR